jgi:hypothetical protein
MEEEIVNMIKDHICLEESKYIKHDCVLYASLWESKLRIEDWSSDFGIDIYRTENLIRLDVVDGTGTEIYSTVYTREEYNFIAIYSELKKIRNVVFDVDENIIDDVIIYERDKTIDEVLL